MEIQGKILSNQEKQLETLIRLEKNAKLSSQKLLDSVEGSRGYLSIACNKLSAVEYRSCAFLSPGLKPGSELKRLLQAEQDAFAHSCARILKQKVFFFN
jgi:hypothetical protein